MWVNLPSPMEGMLILSPYLQFPQLIHSDIRLLMGCRADSINRWWICTHSSLSLLVDYCICISICPLPLPLSFSFFFNQPAFSRRVLPYEPVGFFQSQRSFFLATVRRQPLGLCKSPIGNHNCRSRNTNNNSLETMPSANIKITSDIASSTHFNTFRLL